jgi:hypothetical protein
MHFSHIESNRDDERTPLYGFSIRLTSDSDIT